MASDVAVERQTIQDITLLTPFFVQVFIEYISSSGIDYTLYSPLATLTRIYHVQTLYSLVST